MTLASVAVAASPVVEPARAFDLWEDEVRRTCGTLQVIGDRDRFGAGTIATRVFGSMRVSRITADPHAVVRHDRVASNEGGHVYVVTLLNGTARLCQDGTDITVRTGDLVAFDSSRPYTLAMPQPFTMVGVRAPHRSLGMTPQKTSSITAAPWNGKTGVGALASHTFAALGYHLAELDDAAREPLGTTVGGMITTLFAERLCSAVVDPAAARQLLVLRICGYAQEHMGDSALSPAMLARRHNISLRYLQVLFAEQGSSPARWIRDQRLERLRTDLVNPRYDHLTVSAIAERWGLVDASQVSRLFRMKYGVSPREYRRTRGETANLSPLSPLGRVAPGWR
ncbi:helix-turn-helix domain-containing protein [Actinokineospora globicatena]|uniref:AraC family transcriptional regulator n=1 Tax=Actinokineospora globicatena TaxID=103729 RepID=A0A9W6QHM2_9PSEU|nr:helix-turn-helix domain-containing protein [Actinokineospora globicatena]MCP2302855.1 AraC-type DNA-binding protein [Actinokineospora globicatena]GLW78762.1 AraC family transcriptional regulator [Actinokineospora globicatena]GLW84570.1 AraC family transcriptional regulator [Actinokineospora globicatena]GLW91231.1 AraC family transcriptional regulator [Actinokineospora globicatena]